MASFTCMNIFKIVWQPIIESHKKLNILRSCKKGHPFSCISLKVLAAIMQPSLILHLDIYRGRSPRNIKILLKIGDGYVIAAIKVPILFQIATEISSQCTPGKVNQTGVAFKKRIIMLIIHVIHVNIYMYLDNDISMIKLYRFLVKQENGD